MTLSQQTHFISAPQSSQEIKHPETWSGRLEMQILNGLKGQVFIMRDSLLGQRQINFTIGAVENY